MGSRVDCRFVFLFSGRPEVNSDSGLGIEEGAPPTDDGGFCIG